MIKTLIFTIIAFVIIQCQDDDSLKKEEGTSQGVKQFTGYTSVQFNVADLFISNPSLIKNLRSPNNNTYLFKAENFQENTSTLNPMTIRSESQKDVTSATISSQKLQKGSFKILVKNVDQNDFIKFTIIDDSEPEKDLLTTIASSKLNNNDTISLNISSTVITKLMTNNLNLFNQKSILFFEKASNYLYQEEKENKYIISQLELSAPSKILLLKYLTANQITTDSILQGKIFGYISSMAKSTAEALYISSPSTNDYMISFSIFQTLQDFNTNLELEYNSFMDIISNYTPEITDRTLLDKIEAPKFISNSIYLLDQRLKTYIIETISETPIKSCKTDSILINEDCQPIKSCDEDSVLWDPLINSCVIINEDLPLVNTNSSSSKIAEDINITSFTVTLSRPSFADVSVDFTLTEETLYTIENYSTENDEILHNMHDGSVTIAAGDIATTIIFNVFNTDEYQPDQKLSIQLHDPINAELGENIQYDIIIEDTISDKTAVTMAADDLTEQSILGDNNSLNEITSNLILPASGLYETSITWTLPSYIQKGGTVNRPSYLKGDQTVVIKAVIAKGSSQTTKEFTLTLIKNEMTDQEAVSLATDDISNSQILANNSSWDNILSNLTFPTSGLWETSISWETDSTSIITNDGVVTRPAYNVSNMSIIITATISKGPEQKTKTFTAIVIRSLPPLIITEVFSGTAPDNGWVEIYNTTDVSITLSNYKIRSCSDATENCNSNSTETFTLTSPSPSDPNIAIGSNQYMLIHPYNDETAGETDLYIDGLNLLKKKDLAEIIEISSNKTIDYVRWDDDTYNGNAPNPITGSFNESVNMDSANYGTSIGRKYPLTDQDTAEEWIFYQHSTPGGPNPTYLPIDETDSDNDGISDEDEQNTYQTDPNISDTDGDGFSDGQEILDEGIAGINIKALGANPLVRDIFMEIDYMANPAGEENSATDTTISAGSLNLRKAALDKVKAVFDNYDPTGDDNTYPIKIHFDVGDKFDQSEGIDSADYDLGGGNEIPFYNCINLGPKADCAADHYELKQQNHDLNRRFVFHYFIMGWSQSTNGSITNSSGGLGELNGNDAIITINSTETDETFITNRQAAVILHELGHNLGLKHGGDVDLGYKPNYVSTMNYLYLNNGLDTDNDGDVFYFEYDYTKKNGGPSGTVQDLDLGPYNSDFVINFSQGLNNTINEASLNEEVGWAGVEIDFNNDDTITTGSTITVNINSKDQLTGSDNDTTDDNMEDVDDWNILDLAFQKYLPSQSTGKFREIDDRQPIAKEKKF